MITRCLMGVFVFTIDAAAASVVPVFMDNKITLEIRSQTPDMDSINVINLFTSRIESRCYLICITQIFHIETMELCYLYRYHCDHDLLNLMLVSY